MSFKVASETNQGRSEWTMNITLEYGFGYRLMIFNEGNETNKRRSDNGQWKLCKNMDFAIAKKTT